MSESAPKFTLRFHDQRTHDLLGVVAKQFGVSKNSLATEMLERELETAALLVERDLDGTLQKLRSYRREERIEDDIAAFAEGEGSGDDPLRARMVETDLVERSRFRDAYGVMEAFRS
jgi:hypothetical protein